MNEIFINTKTTYIYLMSSWILQPTVQKIIEVIANNNEISEKSIKKAIKLKENEIRKVLYKLEELGIVVPVGAITLKNGKLDFKWKVKITDIEDIYRIIVNREIYSIDREIEEMPDVIYYCTDCGISYNIDDAYENNFHCKECGSILIEKENYKKFELIETKKKLLELIENIGASNRKKEEIKEKQ